MTRVALIADIHGNLVALEAVLDDLAPDPPDLVVCLGDTAATGPQPDGVLERLRDLGVPSLMGNADAELLGLEPYPDGSEDARRFGDTDRWCASRLGPASLAYLRSFAPALDLPLGGGLNLRCHHGSPRSYNDAILPTTPDAELAAMLGSAGPDVLAGGHTHLPMLRRWAQAILVNPGSVGMAYDRSPGSGDVRLAPWAEYAVVTAGTGRLNVELRRVPFDIVRFRTILRDSAMPHAGWWAAQWGG